MSTINKVILIGHLGDDIHIHVFEGGGMVGNVPMATNENWKDKDTGEKKSRTDWHNLVFRNKGAELMEKYTQKGDKVYVEGKLRTREWTDNENVKHYTTEVHVREFKFMSTKAERPDNAESLTRKQNEKAGDQQKPVKNFPNPNPGDDDHDDLPF